MFKTIFVITLFMFLGTVLPGLILLPAQYLGVDLSELQGADFNLTFVNATLVLIFSGGMVAFVYVVQRFYHRRSFWDLGFKREWVGPLIKGHLIGALIVAVPFGFGLALSENVQVSNAIPASAGTLTVAGTFLFFLFMLTLNSFKEELLYRSYPLENIGGESMSAWTTILIASVIFSVVHLVLEPFTWAAFVYRFLFGVLVCQFYLGTRSIWPIVGIHNGVNWFQMTFTGNWKMGGFLSVTVGAENTAFSMDSTHSIVSLTIAIVVYEWIRRKSGGYGAPAQPESV